MRVWIVSDLHTEHSPWVPDYVPDHDAMVVAGDLTEGMEKFHESLALLRRMTKRPVIGVPGNHDHFGEMLGGFAQWEGGVHILPAGDVVVIDGVRFVGATLWTDWHLGDKEWAAQAWAARSMPEYARVTRSDGELIWPIDTSNQHEIHRARIEGVLSRRHEGPTVVVTHHAPSALSLRPGEIRSVEAAAYASDLEAVMMEFGPDLWVHGHTHHACDYHVGATRVISNPRGYVGDDWTERTGWQEDLVIEV